MLLVGTLIQLRLSAVVYQIVQRHEHVVCHFCEGGDAVVRGFFFFFQAEDGIRDIGVTGVQTCALPISRRASYPCAGAAPAVIANAASRRLRRLRKARSRW